eukprot:8969773-Alexandrium_andersonii.AAC.1
MPGGSPSSASGRLRTTARRLDQPNPPARQDGLPKHTARPLRTSPQQPDLTDCSTQATTAGHL